ncbi:RNA polymerase sigma factor [Raineya orbicola]|uniref:Sigma70-ECF: RNA polymerase sigma factor, sigma-70 family n=1 Tax=Raineya orbicola TaxID=2016530 RepID=A0A2N3IJT6_9BACT|nr:sigma-70 family RNA polymerase sigma factor [Raineya orbicola]PKQ70518.1 sigma70-ECF: RNA polymerase sigma factor, sigma-70 family [Raineya orbicola]
MSDVQTHIIEACRKQCPKAQRKLYEQYASKMFAVALRYTSGRLEAEDVLQESFIKVFNHIQTFRGECSLEHWIKKIVINTALKQNRSKLYLFPAFDVQDLPEEYQETCEILENLEYEDLLNMVQSLAPRYRVVFNLYAIEGYQHNEIAEMLGISEGTSKSQYARAKQILKEMILRESRQTQKPNYERS